MVKLLMRKTLTGLEPCDGETMPRCAVGDVLKVNITQPRNIGHHRKFYALCNLVFENQTLYESVDDLVYALKMATSHTKRYPKQKGGFFSVPQSISFSKMDQTEFDVFYNKIISLVCEQILPNLSESVLKSEIEMLVSR